MDIGTLVTGLMIAHFACSYLIVFKFARLVFPHGYGFKIKWYHKVASSYVLALPIFLLLVYLVGKAGRPNATMRFNNSALTTDGQLCIGMTHHIKLNRYSCTYLQTDGVRDFGGACSWDLEGGSLDGLSDLNLKTIQDGIRAI